METARAVDLETMLDMHEALSVGWNNGVVSAPALIPALREAVFGGMESTGGAGGFDAKMPIDSSALDLYQAIDQEISEAWAAAFPNQIPTADKVESLLAQFVAVTHNDPSGNVSAITVVTQRVDNPGTRDEHWWVERTLQEFDAEQLMRRWVKKIIDFFNPPRRREITSPCVECGEQWAWKFQEGDSTPYRVFVFEQDANGNTLGAACLSCGSRWGLGSMMELAQRMREAEASSRQMSAVSGRIIQEVNDDPDS